MSVVKKRLKVLKYLLKQENGAIVFLTALILLGLGGVIMTPVLSYMSTGAKATQVYEDKSFELYAADAGVEDAIWQIRNGTANVPALGNSVLYSLGETLNGQTGSVTIYNIDDTTYKITSTATGSGGGTTSVESYVDTETVSYLDNAITSSGNVTLKNGVTVEGDVFYGGSLTDGGATVNPEPTHTNVDVPDSDEVDLFYKNQVIGLSPDYGLTIDVDSGIESSPVLVGPLYVIGNLTITGSGWLRLNGTVYVTGNIEVKNSCTIEMNDNTIFTRGDIDLKNGCTFIGSGCIIAIGKIDFRTNNDTDPDGFIFVMSLEDNVILHNADTFTGALGGNVEVELKNGCSLNNPDPPESLNLPDEFESIGSDSASFDVTHWKVT